MSGDDDTTSNGDDEIEFDLDEIGWDDALAELEDELDETEATEAHLSEARPLYRPPSPDDQFARRPAAKPAPSAPNLDDLPMFDEVDDDDAFVSTKIAEIPQELINSLVTDQSAHQRPTKPPPPQPSRAGAELPKDGPPSVDLDLDGLLDGFEEETAIYPGSASPVAAEGESEPELFGARRPSGTGWAAVRPTPVPAEAPRDEAAAERPPSFSDETTLDVEASGAQPTAAPSEPSDAATAFDGADDETVIGAPPDLPPDDPGENPTPLRPPPSPRSPTKAAGPAIPRPGVPRPSVPRPSIPRPDGARAKLPPIPKPGARPSVPKPKLPIPKPKRPGGVPKPFGGPTAKRPFPSLKKPTPPEDSPPATVEPTSADAPAAPAAKGAPSALGAPGERGAPSATGSPAEAPADREPPGAAAPTPREETSPEDTIDADLDALLAMDKSRSVPPPAAEAVEVESAEITIAEDGDGDSAEILVEEPGDDGPDVAIGDVSGEIAIGGESAEIAIGEVSGEVAIADDDEPDIAFDDDDEPDIAIGDDDELDIAIGDDDEPDIAFDDDDDGLAVVETSADEDWDDEDWEALEAAEAEADAALDEARPAPAPVANDRGAVAARRSVRSRKPRDEHFPMVGDGPEALRLRMRLLKSLAGNRQGGVRARLLVGAAELAEQLGDADDAREMYVQALASDPQDLVALRALRRDAVARGHWDKLATLYEREAKLDLGAPERAMAWTALAELYMGRLDKPAQAEAAAQKALEAQPTSIAATLLLAEARWRQGRPAEAVEGFGAAREIWDDPDARAALAVEEARVAEGAGDEAKARELYTWANDVDPEALDGWFGRARTSSRAGADPEGAVEALATIAAYCGGPLGEAILTRASRVATRIKKDPTLGVKLLGEATGVLPLQARADAAVATGDADLELTCLAAWAGAAGGTDRALALVRTAETRARTGDLDGAEAALRDAALADGSLGTIRVVREVIARRSGDVSRLADAIDGGGALAGAARIARDPSALDREHELLLEAVAEGAALVAADVIGLDVSAARDDDLGIEDALRRQADRVPPEQRTGSLLALTDRAIEREDLDAAERLLEEARGLAPGDPLALRPLGRLALRRSPEAAAALWLEESSAADGTRAAFAATQAGHLLAASGGDALGAYRRALEASAGYRPAAWALKPVAMEVGDPLTLGEVYEQLAATSAEPRDAAKNLVRGALLRAAADPSGAAELLARAHQHAPGDMVLTSLQMRLASDSDPAGRARILAGAAERASAPLGRVYRLQAAQAFEEAGDHAAAAIQYLGVSKSTPGDAFITEALDRNQIAADQVARVAERRMAAVKAAASDEERAVALERLAELDLLHREDAASAVLSLQAILEHVPGHLPSLRTLHRYYAAQGRQDDAADVVAAQAEHLAPGPDVTAYARLARRLMLRGTEATPERSDALLLRVAHRADFDLWLAPRVLAAALDAGEPEPARAAARALANLLGAVDERASSRLRAAELLAPVDPQASVELLREAVHASPTHPLAASALGEASEAAGDLAAAADAYEAAGAAATVPARAASLFYRAARIWQDQFGDAERARAALTRASEHDVTHEDVFERLRTILDEVDDKAALADLYQHRLTAGADDAKLVELYIKQAELRTAISDLSGAKDALRSALTLQPERIDALRSLANLCLEDEDWRGAAEVLIRIARIRKEREELRWVFFTLGDIYDQHMPDPRRAEAAFRRVLKLFPNDLPAMERLAELYRRQNQLPQAAQVLEDLAAREVDLEASRGHRLRLAQIHEQLGDARKAEQVLDEARKGAPTDLEVIRALADFYQRQNASNAMAMHLRRAVNDFRHALEADLSDRAAWPGLVEVLGWNNKPDAAAAAASAATAVGVVDIELSKLVDARGAAPGASAGAAEEGLDELLAPAALGAPARAVFKLAGEALEKSLPFDVNAYRAERIDSRDTRIRPLALEVARWFKLSPVELFVTSAAPRVCVPVQSNPCALLIGAELLGITDDREKLFVLARAFKIAQARLSVVVRSQPQEVVALLGGLVQSYDPHHVPPGADPSHVAEAARRVSKNVGRKVADELGPLVFEMAGRPGYDPSTLAMAASEWGNRTALVASGSAPAAMSALAKLSGERELPTEPSQRVALIQRFAEASTLLGFAVSDAHFEARARAGAGTR